MRKPKIASAHRFIDGSHVRCRPEYQKRHLDVVVGKIETRDMCRRFGLSPQAAGSPVSQPRRDLKCFLFLLDHCKNWKHPPFFIVAQRFQIPLFQRNVETLWMHLGGMSSALSQFFKTEGLHYLT